MLRVVESSVQSAVAVDPGIVVVVPAVPLMVLVTIMDTPLDTEVAVTLGFHWLRYVRVNP